MKVGLPKGALLTRSRAVLGDYFGAEPERERLHFVDTKHDVHFFLLKQRDMPGLLHAGKLDLAIVSTEWIIERGFALATLATLDWCNTRVSILLPKGDSLQSLTAAPTVRCATEFPNTASTFFATTDVNRVSIEPVNGSTEAYVPTLCHCAIDCVETGATLQANNLQEAQVIGQHRMVVATKDRAHPNELAVLHKLTL